MSDKIVITLQQLRGLIGIRMYHQDILCQVIEVLEDGPSIVLQAVNQTRIQNNQHGGASRHAPVTYTIPVLSPDQTELHPSYLALELE